MFCPNCGSKISDSAAVCMYCHSAVAHQQKEVPFDYKEDYSRAKAGLLFLSVMIPIAGIILWFNKRKSEPRAAKTYGIVGLLMWILSMFEYILIAFALLA